MLLLCSRCASVVFSERPVGVEAASDFVPSSTSGLDATRCLRPLCDVSRPLDFVDRPVGETVEMVEAAGIEPASRDISARASTCVVS